MRWQCEISSLILHVDLGKLVSSEAAWFGEIVWFLWKSRIVESSRYDGYHTKLDNINVQNRSSGVGLGQLRWKSSPLGAIVDGS